MIAPYHPPVKYSIEIKGHKTSVSLEPVFWEILKEIAHSQGVPINSLIAQIDEERIHCNQPSGLASAIRVWLITR